MNQEADKDWEWVAKVQNGDTDSFEPLVIKYQRKTFNILYRWLGDYDEAAEAAQEVFLRAFRALKNFRGDSSFSTWLYRITINQAKNRHKSRANIERRRVDLKENHSDHDGDLLDKLPNPGPNPAQEAERNETRERVQHGINQLDDEEAVMVILHDLQELSYDEIGSILEIPLGTVKSRLHRARAALREKITLTSHPAQETLKEPLNEL